MKSVNIRLTMMTGDIENFVISVNRFPKDMNLGSGGYVVDAKSILGSFSLVRSRPIRMDMYRDSCDDLLKGLEPYIIQDAPVED